MMIFYGDESLIWASLRKTYVLGYNAHDFFKQLHWQNWYRTGLLSFHQDCRFPANWECCQISFFFFYLFWLSICLWSFIEILKLCCDESLSYVKLHVTHVPGCCSRAFFKQLHWTEFAQGWLNEFSSRFSLFLTLCLMEAPLTDFFSLFWFNIFPWSSMGIWSVDGFSNLSSRP